MAQRSWRTRARSFPRRVVQRMRIHGDSLVLSALSAGLAYAIASAALWSQAPFFAPIAAIITTGLAAGQRLKRAIEIATGVIVGLVVGDIFVLLVGSGVWQLAAAVFLVSTIIVVVFGAGMLMSNQGAVAAVLVVALMPAQSNVLGTFERAFEAVIGSAAALLLTMIVSPDPLRRLRGQASEIMLGLVAVVDEISLAIQESNIDRAHGALRDTNEVARRIHELDDALASARETFRLARHRRSVAQAVGPLQRIRSRMDMLISTLRGLARTAANSVRHGVPLAPELLQALHLMSTALEELEGFSQGKNTVYQAQEAALESAKVASEILARPSDLRETILVGQLRSAAIDVLRATGLPHEEAVKQMEEAAGRADQWRW